MLVFFSAIHVLLCIFMIFVILLQPGKDAGMGSALGGGAASSAFGGRGAVTFLGKVTAFCAIGFFATSLGLSFVGLRASVADDVVVPVPTPLPGVVPPTPTAPTPTSPNPRVAPTDAPAADEAPKP
jgi:preprotein translocase subunit SecG